MMLTWRAPDASRMESVRIQLSGDRIKAIGRIVAAATDGCPAFHAYYDLLTDDAGAARRVGLRVTMADRERQLSIARDEENMWLITNNNSETRAAFDGALDVDLTPSPFFAALPVRRAGTPRPATLTVPVIRVGLPELQPDTATVSYRCAGDQVVVALPSGEAALRVDADGFTLDCPELAERI